MLYHIVIISQIAVKLCTLEAQCICGVMTSCTLEIQCMCKQTVPVLYQRKLCIGLVCVCDFFFLCILHVYGYLATVENYSLNIHNFGGTAVIAVPLDYALPAVIFPLIVYDMFTLMLARIVLHDVIISL